MSRPRPLTYLSDQSRDWARALRAAQTLGALQALTADWGAWVPDAHAIAVAMSAADFVAFRRGLLAKTDDLAWAGRFGALAVPARLLEISVMAAHFTAPFGTAAIRACELGGKRMAWLKKIPGASGVSPRKPTP